MEPPHGITAASNAGQRSSNRAFGMVFAVVFVIVAIAPVLFGKTYILWALVVAALFALTGWLTPALLTYPNRLWLAFGAFLHAIVSPVMLAAIFYVTLLPIGFVMRLFGKDFLSMRRDVDKSTYWVERRPPGPPPNSLKNQF